MSFFTFVGASINAISTILSRHSSWNRLGLSSHWWVAILPQIDWSCAAAVWVALLSEWIGFVTLCSLCWSRCSFWNRLGFCSRCFEAISIFSNDHLFWRLIFSSQSLCWELSKLWMGTVRRLFFFSVVLLLKINVESCIFFIAWSSVALGPM